MAQADFGFNPIGSGAALSSVQTSVAVTITPASGATKVLVQAFTQNLRFTLDASAPTSVQGFQITAGDPPMLIPVVAGGLIKVIQDSTGATAYYQFGN